MYEQYTVDGSYYSLFTKFIVYSPKTVQPRRTFGNLFQGKYRRKKTQNLFLTDKKLYKQTKLFNLLPYSPPLLLLVFLFF